MKYKHKNVKQACKEVIETDNSDIHGDIGIIAIDKEGNVAAEFNSERMLRGWRTGTAKAVTKIYKD